MTSEPRTSDADGYYLRGEAARAAGRLEDAERCYRAALDHDPRHRARRELITLLSDEARRLASRDDRAEAIARLQAALTLARKRKTRVRLQRRLLTQLRHQTHEALLRGNTKGARRSIAEALDLAPDDAATRSLAEVIELLPPLPLLPDDSGAHRSETDTRPKTFVFIEAGVDTRLLPYLLEEVGEGDVYSETRLKPVSTSGGDIHPRALPDLGIDVHAEASLVHQIHALRSKLYGRLKSLLPPRYLDRHGLNLLDLATADLASVMIGPARSLTTLAELLAKESYDRALIVLGNDVVNRALRQAVAGAVGSERAFFLWASREHGRYDRSARALASVPDLLPHRRISPLSSILTTVKGIRARAVRRRARAFRRRHQGTAHTASPRGTVQLIALPNWLKVRQGVSITAALSRRMPIAVVPKRPKRPDYESIYDEYRRLAAESDNVSIVDDVVDPKDGPPSPPLRLVSRVDHALAELGEEPEVRAAARMGPLDLWSIADDRLRYLLAERLPSLRHFTDRWIRHLDASKPAAIVLLSAGIAEWRIVCLTAERRGIPTVFAQSVFMSDSYPRYDAPHAAYATVVDQHTKDLIVRHLKFDPRNVFVTGMPRFDAILERRRQTPAGVRSDRVGRPRVKKVLLINQRFEVEYQTRLIRMAARALERVQGSQLTVKMHYSEPLDRIEEYEAALENHASIASRVCRDEDLYTLVQEADLVVATFSNVVLEAAMLDSVILCVNLWGAELPVPFVELGVAEGAATEEEAEQKIVALLTDDAVRQDAEGRRDRYFAANSHLLDRPAAEAIADVVARLAEST